MSPYLFGIVLDYVMRQTYQNREVELGFQLRKRQSRRMAPITITDLNFADDRALITEEKEQNQDILNILEHEAGKVCLQCRLYTVMLRKPKFKHSTTKFLLM